MKDFHEQLKALLTQADLHQQTLEELDDAIVDLENRLGRMRWQRQQTLRKLREVLRQLAELLSA